MNFITRGLAWFAVNRRDAAKLIVLVAILTGSGVAMGWFFDILT